jgi:hypothetical protein
MCKSYENDYIEERVNAIKESIHFFSNKCKSEREIWVVKHFLSQLKIEFQDKEIYPSPDEPFDVVFRYARFQIKEILYKNRKRSDEYKELLHKTEKSTSPSDLLEPYQPQMINCANIIPIVVEKVSELQKKYGPSERISIDLLFYFNLQNTHVVDDKFPNVDCCSSKMAGWRSVSVDTGDCAIILHISQYAPNFIRASKGKVHRNPSIWLEK